MKKLSEIDGSQIFKMLNTFDFEETVPKEEISPDDKTIKSILEGLNKIDFTPECIILEVKASNVFLKTSKDDTSSIPLFGLYTKKHLTGNEEFDKLKYQLFFARLYKEMQKQNQSIADKLYFNIV
jgi:hypothetical protein